MNTQVTLSVNETNLVNNLRHAFTNRSNVISELMQNARRSGAKHIRFTVNNDHLCIDDDGSGIQDFTTLLSVASSHWTQEVIENESPFGLGFLAALYACKHIKVDSCGQRIEGATQDILNQAPLTITHSPMRVGTTIVLTDHGYDIDKLFEDIKDLSMGFPIPVYVNNDEIERPHSIDNLEGVYTDIGYLYLIGVHDGTGKPWSPTCVYLQGLPLIYNGDEKHRNVFRAPYNIYPGADASNILHLDSSKYTARVPDRNVLLEPDKAEHDLSLTVDNLFWDRINDDKIRLSENDFVKKWWDFCFHSPYLSSRLSSNQKMNFEAIFNDVETIPGQVLYKVVDYPYVLKPDEDIDAYAHQAENACYHKSEIEKLILIAVDELCDRHTYKESANAIAYMFSMNHDKCYLLPDYFSDYSKLDKGHWLHTHVENAKTDISKLFSYKLINIHKRANFKGEWIRDIDVSFVESCEVIHEKTGESVAISQDAFMLPDQTIVHPTLETSGVVVAQAELWCDDEIWALDAQEKEEVLYNRFILSERAENSVSLLQQLLSDNGFDKYTVLKGTTHEIKIDQQGKISIMLQD